MSVIGRERGHAPDGPVIAMRVAGRGRADGERRDLHPIRCPTLSARATPADSLETISYALDATSPRLDVDGELHVIRAPDLIALARGTGARRCEQTYELWGYYLSVNERTARGGRRTPLRSRANRAPYSS